MPMEKIHRMAGMHPEHLHGSMHYDADPIALQSNNRVTSHDVRLAKKALRDAGKI